MRGLIFGMVLVLSLAVSPGARAFDNLIGFSPTEIAGFAFYNYVGLTPVFEDWIMNEYAYKENTAKGRLDLMDKERARLKEGYASYAPDRDLIRITTAVTYDISPAADGKGWMVAAQIPNVAGMPMIPFQVGKIWVGLVTDNPDAIFSEVMSPEEFQKFCGSAGVCDDPKGKLVKTSFIFRPRRADADKPLAMEDKTPIYILFADVASVYIKPTKTQPGWSYSSEWYDTKGGQELNGLFK